jgi:hypothetical protein
MRDDYSRSKQEVMGVGAVAGQAAGDVGSHGTVGRNMSGVVRPERTAIDTLPPETDYSDQVILLGRLKPGTALESRRVMHVFLLAPDLLRQTTLTARCGEALPSDDMQWLPRLAGMPCEPCVLLSVAGR